jgi:hypothetical protein
MGIQSAMLMNGMMELLNNPSLKDAQLANFLRSSAVWQRAFKYGSISVLHLSNVLTVSVDCWQGLSNTSTIAIDRLQALRKSGGTSWHFLYGLLPLLR